MPTECRRPASGRMQAQNPYGLVMQGFQHVLKNQQWAFAGMTVVDVFRVFIEVSVFFTLMYQ